MLLSRSENIFSSSECDFRTGEVYRGKLIEAEDNMNCQMQQITVTYRDGRMATLENVYIRGSKIRFLILPDMLKNAPMFKNNKSGNKSGTAGRGKSAILRAQGKSIGLLERIDFHLKINF
jgi:LSM domain